ncbi:MAG TPA: lysophospholipid acyltransferase family protein [Dongiaceae bacterium]|jgi:lysophospholipid acyltransferase (LPLAT)-like uncharacterized protein|nr:lysophospholipid acyltransferase family protein [Dongiaceae bacterium]
MSAPQPPEATRPSDSSASGPKKSSGFTPHRPKWHQRLGAFVVFALLRLVMATMRYRHRGAVHFFSPGAPAPAIFCLWHNRLASCIKALDIYRRPNNGGAGMAALVSASKDGAFLSGILELFRVQPVRGSSSRRGALAMLELTTWAERGYDLTITPDGPRGPCYQIQDGILSLGQMTGLPIVPVALNLNWKIRLKSWDRFQIPLPFARCEVCLGEPLVVPREATEAERDTLRVELERRMRAMTQD